MISRAAVCLSLVVRGYHPSFGRLVYEVAVNGGPIMALPFLVSNPVWVLENPLHIGSRATHQVIQPCYLCLGQICAFSPSIAHLSVLVPLLLLCTEAGECGLVFGSNLKL